MQVLYCILLSLFANLLKYCCVYTKNGIVFAIINSFLFRQYPSAIDYEWEGQNRCQHKRRSASSRRMSTRNMTGPLAVTLGSLMNSPIWNDETETTLREILKNPYKPGSISKELGIHRNSLYYRIEKIEEFSGLNLKSPHDFLKIKIAFMLYDLFFRNEKQTY